MVFNKLRRELERRQKESKGCSRPAASSRNQHGVLRGFKCWTAKSQSRSLGAQGSSQERKPRLGAPILPKTPLSRSQVRTQWRGGTEQGSHGTTSFMQFSSSSTEHNSSEAETCQELTHSVSFSHTRLKDHHATARSYDNYFGWVWK